MSKRKTRQSSKQSSPSSQTTANLSAEQTPTVSGEAITSSQKAQSTTSSSASAATSTKLAQELNTAVKSTLPSTAKALTRDAAKYERRQAERQQRYLAQRRAKRNKLITIATIALVVVLAGSLTTYFVYNAQHTKASTTTTSQSSFTEPIFDNNYPPVGGVYCDQLEGSVMHIHAHLSIYINGALTTLPQFVGIPGGSSGSATCFYWLHTHDTSGIIHMESPVLETFTLGQFLNEWDQQFNSLGYPSQLLLDNGWTSWINGQEHTGSITTIPLTAHALVTIAYNSPNAKPDTVYSWPAGL
jgi:hypothetical protein